MSRMSAVIDSKYVLLSMEIYDKPIPKSHLVLAINAIPIRSKVMWTPVFQLQVSRCLKQKAKQVAEGNAQK